MTLGIFIYTPWGRLKEYEVLDTENMDEALKRFEETRKKCLKTEFLYLTRAGKDIERVHLRLENGLK